MKSVVEQGFFHEFTFNDKALKTFVKFRICCKRSKFECCQIRIGTSSQPYISTRHWNALTVCTGWLAAVDSCIAIHTDTHILAS